ncbi:TRAP transporter small permease [Cloacibacillus evryensis]|uniref:TRAP transporter small permease n=1 Tax=Cloacibacillus evryensis TaxID=508460 RepID=UPI002109480D|nr:TRAP transporter small permease [Cloacibacillus evryensis]MCQ4762793.1 TRAP transporter small permease [Cloacibacillus evryensis]
MRNFASWLKKVEEFVMIWSSLILMVLLVYTVFMRYIFNRDVLGMDELEVCVAFWLYFIASANCSNNGTQITADILNIVCKNCPKVQKIINAMTSLLSACVGIVFTYFSFAFFDFAFQRSQRTLILRLPVTSYYIAIVLGLVLMSVYHFRDFVITAKELRRGEVQ